MRSLEGMTGCHFLMKPRDKGFVFLKKTSRTYLENERVVDLNVSRVTKNVRVCVSVSLRSVCMNLKDADFFSFENLFGSKKTKHSIFSIVFFFVKQLSLSFVGLHIVIRCSGRAVQHLRLAVVHIGINGCIL